MPGQDNRADSHFLPPQALKSKYLKAYMAIQCEVGKVVFWQNPLRIKGVTPSILKIKLKPPLLHLLLKEVSSDQTWKECFIFFHSRVSERSTVRSISDIVRNSKHLWSTWDLNKFKIVWLKHAVAPSRAVVAWVLHQVGFIFEAFGSLFLLAWLPTSQSSGRKRQNPKHFTS